jgi:hypothetical protein
MNKKLSFQKEIVLILFFMFTSISFIPFIYGTRINERHDKWSDLNDTSDDSFDGLDCDYGMPLWGWWWPEFPGKFEPFFDVEELIDFESGTTGLTSDDFNDDGLLDIGVSWRKSVFDENFHSNITILYNNGPDNDFTRRDVFSIDYDRIEDLDSADYDGDGDIDFLFTYTISVNSSNRIGVGKLVLNDGDNVFHEEKLAFYHEYNPDRKRINPHVSSADFDNDGDIDFIVGDNSGLVAFYKNDGMGHFTWVCDSDFEGRIISWGVANADFDNDGDIDFMVTECDNTDVGNIYLKYNDGTNSCFNHSNYKVVADLPVSNYESFLSTFFPIADGCLCSIDYNDDGLMDLMYGGAGNIFLFIQQEDRVFEPFTVARFPGVKQQGGGWGCNNLRSGGITVGDVDGDGLDDAIVGGSYGIAYYFHNELLLVDIIFPDRNCRVIDNELYDFIPLYPFFKHSISLVKGDITVIAKELEPLSKVEFYLDGKLVFTDNMNPFEWKWDRLSLGGIHKVKAVAYDLNGEQAGFDDTIIWKFF